MSTSVVERLSDYVPVETYAGTFNEASLIPEPQPEPIPSLAVSWRNAKRSLDRLGDRFRQSKSELKAIGHLAVLDVDSASVALSNPQTPELSPIVFRQPSFRERVWENVGHIEKQKSYDRRKKFQEIRQKVPWFVAGVGLAAITGYLSTKG